MSPPTIDGATNPADIAESTGGSSSQDIASVSGTITVSDGDTLSVSVTDDATASYTPAVGAPGGIPDGPAVNVAALIAFAAISFDGLTSDGNHQTIDWHYDPASADLDWLRAGDTLTLTFVAQVSAGTTTVNQNLVITITGTNDAPTIDTATNPVAIAESAGNSSSQDIGPVSGTITITDQDLGDTLTVSVTGNATATYNGGVPGDLPSSLAVDVAALIASDAINFDGLISNGGQRTINWHYDPASADLDWLRAGDTLTVSFVAQVFDGTTTVNQNLVITITGTNDAPTIDTATNPVAIAESAGNSSSQDIGPVSGTITITDQDLGDTLTGSVTGNATATYNGGVPGDLPSSLAVDVAALIASDAINFDRLISNGGQRTINWHYDPTAADLDWLAVGETLTITYVAKVDDGHGSVGSQNLVITITGTNDVPVAGNDVATFAEDAGSVIHPKVVTGTVFDNDSDLDLSDQIVVSAVAAGALTTLNGTGVGTVVQGAYGKLTLNSDGTYSYAFLNTDAVIFGETPISDVFHYEISDGHGGFDDATLTINIDGTDLDLAIVPPTEDSHDADPFIAQRGNDVIRGTGLAETIFGRDGNDQLFGFGGADNLDGENGDDRLWGGGNDDRLTGGAGTDVVRGEDGNDTIVGGTGGAGAGNDIYDGGANSDTLDYSGTTLGVTVDLNASIRSAQAISGPLATIGALLDAGGYDGSQSVGLAFGAEIDSDALLNIENVTGGTGADTITGDGNANILRGGIGNDALRGVGGADTLYGDEGNDLADGGAGNDVIIGGIGAGAGYDVYDGGGDTDTVDYSSTLLGVSVNLTALNRSAEAVSAPDGAGPNPDTIGDLLNSKGIGPTTAAGRADGSEIATDALLNIENVIGGAGADTIIGDAVANILTGNGGVDQIWGQGGDDTIRGGDGDDSLVGGIGSGAPSGNDTIFGDAGDDKLYGEDGNDTLWGGTGSDQYAAGAGNDTLYFEGDGVSDTAWGGSESDSFVFQKGFGVDTIKDFLAVGAAGDKIDLRAFVNLSFAGLVVTQVGQNVEITGLGTGNKIILEVVNAGAISADDFIFGPFVAGVTRNGTAAGEPLTGGAGNDTLNGAGGNDTLTGLAGNDTLNGGAGADTMLGGSDDDTYVVDDAGDVVDETGGDGFDIVQSSITFSLSDAAHVKGAVEHLTLTGSAAINATGNDLNNFLTGNSAANVLISQGGDDTLNGGAGADTMKGGLGSDTYVVDNAGDVVDETGGDGTDTVQASISFSLSDAVHVKGFVENLTLTGSSGLTATGNSLANSLTGNTGNNTLAGLGGADILNGGTGTDTATYAASANGVNVSLATGQGHGGDAEGDMLSAIENLIGSGSDDTLEGNAGSNNLNGGANGVLGDTVTYANATAGVTVNLGSALAQNTGGAGTDTLSGFENLTGSALGDTLTGSGTANVLKGLAGNDTLNGGGGADTLVGGLGTDTLTGGTGADAFVFANFAEGLDSITDFASNSDFLAISAAGFGGNLVQGGTVTLLTVADITGATHAGPDGYFLFDNSGANAGMVYWDADGGSASNAVAVVKLQAGAALLSTDFHIIA